MKKLILISVSILFLVGALTIIRDANKSNQELHIKKIELQNNEQKLKDLETKFNDVNGQKVETEQQVKELELKRQQLEKEKSDLEAQLQAKASIKQDRGAVAYAATVPSESVQSIIVAAANKYGVSADLLLRIGRCESTYNPNAINYNYTDPATGTHPMGLFQHVEGYWAARAVKYGHPGASIFDPVAQAEVTAQMFRDGASGLWECK